MDDDLESAITNVDIITNAVIAIANSDYLSEQEKSATITVLMSDFSKRQNDILNKVLEQVMLL